MLERPGTGRSSVRLRYSPPKKILRKRDFLILTMFTVYIIYSSTIDQYYIGHTINLEDRLYRHNNSGSKSTKKAKDWVLKYAEHFESRSKATFREQEIKKKKSRKYIESLIDAKC